MKQLQLAFLFLFISLQANADFELRKVSERRQPAPPNSLFTEITRTEYQVDGTPWVVVHSMGMDDGMERHTVEVFQGSERKKRAAYRKFDVVKKNGEYVAHAAELAKFTKDKGLGILVSLPMLNDSRITTITSHLAHANLDEMLEKIEPGSTENAYSEKYTAKQFNEVVQNHSHFGRMMTSRGYEVVPAKTEVKQRGMEVHVEFRRNPNASACPRAFRQTTGIISE